MSDWPVLCRYDAAHLREIALPVGGIGTGFFALGGRGQLTDWQLMSRPNRGWRPMYSHLLLRTRQPGAAPAVTLRVLEGDLREGLAADSGAPAVLAGIPRWRDAAFEATYPFGRVLLSDPHTPVTAVVEAFNPLIPGETDLSSLPVAILTVTLENQTSAPLEASLTLLLSNFIGTDGIARDLKDNVTERAEAGAPAAPWKGMRFAKSRPARTAQNGTLVVLCDGADVRVARRWAFRDRPWGGEALGIIDALMANGYIDDDQPDQPCPPSPNDTWDSSLSALLSLPLRAAQSVRFLFAWHFPHRNMQEEGWWSGKPGEDPLLGNYYAAKYADALAVAQQVIPRLPELRDRTVSFVKGVADRAAPAALKEAALSNLTALRTHTSFRLADGTFAGFEGCNATTGCCTGSCTHVWNYEEATVHLFPDLHRSMLESHLRYDMVASGAQRFRLSMPMAEPTWNGAAADGQMGVIVRVYQQYLADRDPAWLKQVYPTVRSMLEFAWVPGGWDADRDGVMEGAQHNTYDVEFFGPNPMCTSWYLAALAAMEKMAPLAGDPTFAATCADLRARGSRWVDGNLFNGQYYVQRVEVPKAPPAMFTVLGQEHASSDPRFQVGRGCLIDQLVGQYKANRVGLGELFDRMHAHTAVLNTFRNNYRPHFRDHYNNMRTFATADESGTLICSYPEGGRPAQPFPYWSECMTGFEYQLAVLLLDYGQREEALKVVAAVRGRHNGANRNPFNEPECGSYYARAMASWALLDAWDRSGPIRRTPD
jgi:uncharacterized protein (DUF608 family)